MPTPPPLPPPSSAAQDLYSAAKNDLLQDPHAAEERPQPVVGRLRLPGRHQQPGGDQLPRGVADGARSRTSTSASTSTPTASAATVELLAVDVLHDLAVVRVNRNGTGFFKMPEHLAKLTQGQYLYSLGNPLDLGFAISEGAVQRRRHAQLLRPADVHGPDQLGHERRAERDRRRRGGRRQRLQAP
jgi:serine protease Do